MIKSPCLLIEIYHKFLNNAIIYLIKFREILCIFPIKTVKDNVCKTIHEGINDPPSPTLIFVYWILYYVPLT